MPDIMAVADETAATILIHDAEATLGTLSNSGGGSLGPFGATWGASASFSGGAITLTPPNIIQISNCQLNYSLNFSFSLDLNTILPNFCIPQICIPTPFGDICTPEICISWPTITIPVSYSDSLLFTADFTLNVHLSGGQWLVDVVIVGIPSLTISPAAAAILSAIGAAAALILAPIPFIGPFLAGAVLLITNTIAIAGVAGLLGSILTLFVSGLSFNIYKQPQIFQVLPASPPFDPAVTVTIALITADVEASDKNELVLTADI